MKKKRKEKKGKKTETGGSKYHNDSFTKSTKTVLARLSYPRPHSAPVLLHTIAPLKSYTVLSQHLLNTSTSLFSTCVQHPIVNYSQERKKETEAVIIVKKEKKKQKL